MEICTIGATVSQLWSSAWPAGAMMLGLGGSFALVLLLAHEKLKVESDPKADRIRAVLPGADCGACGSAGCNAYAKAVAADPKLIGRCTPGGGDVAVKVAQILSLQVEGTSHPVRAVVHCNGHRTDKSFRGRYEGIESCLAANALANVQACKFGCLGYGDCVRTCRFGALEVVDGLATIDDTKCTGCTACSKACPRNLIEMVPFSRPRMAVVACNSQENGKTTRAMCKVGCIGCGLCAKQSDLFGMKDNLSRIAYATYRDDPKVQNAMDKCPAKVILWRGECTESSPATSTTNSEVS